MRNRSIDVHGVCGSRQNMGILTSIFKRWNQRTEASQIADNIKTQQYFLSLTMLVDYGLLDKLISLELLTIEQWELIRSKPTETNKIIQLLDEVIKMSDEQQQQFLTALDETQQTHITNYIRANGQWTQQYGDDWP